MSAALSLTAADIIHALGISPAVDDAVRVRAEAAAQELASEGVAARVIRRGAGAYTVEATGDGLFAREFGALERGADPVVAAAVRKVRQP